MTTLTSAALVATLVLTGAVLLLLAAVAVEHARRGRRLARDERRRAELTPLVYAALDDDEDGADALAGLEAAPAPLDDLVLDLLPQLRGADRAALGRLLVRRGVVARAAGELTARAPWRRGRAATLLGNAADPGHTAALTALLADRAADVRCAAARALGKAGDVRATGPLLRALARSRRVPAGVVGMALLDLGTPVLPDLRATVTDPPSPAAQALAADLLGLHGDVEALPLLLGLLADPRRPAAVRCSAATALGRIGVPSATPALGAALAATAGPALRRAAAEALGRIGDDAAIDLLAAAVAGGDDTVRAACADALAGAGEDGRARLAAHAWRAGVVGETARAALSNRPRPRDARIRTAA
ncbi:HEAT repeat protein [Geodermatophilus bullaregiensis]|uniref:HEAT repeat domain-containing protein n=1 Tax=Geodermatophilus bullaregiensis TaxID=1564160 RepID=UPI00195610FC|nr:HEAT repeat domain-containing protein [Geodermatophilus bullaregiensis]MBM7806877.1 HEAT repeat protein [Geodermatophilus bullaregiensis]